MLLDKGTTGAIGQLYLFLRDRYLQLHYICFRFAVLMLLLILNLVNTTLVYRSLSIIGVLLPRRIAVYSA